jgi:hypothetical protein
LVHQGDNTGQADAGSVTPMAMYRTLLLTVDRGVATITLKRAAPAQRRRRPDPTSYGVT